MRRNYPIETAAGRAGAGSPGVLALSRRGLLAGGAALSVSHPLLAAPPPATLYDAHIHFFTNDIDRYPIDPRDAREPEEVMRARIIAAPVEPGPTFALWDRLGVTGGVGVQYRGAYKFDNSYVLDLVEAHRPRVVSEILLSAGDPRSPDYLYEVAAAHRPAAVRLTGYEDDAGTFPWMTNATAQRIWQAAEELGLAVCLTCLPPRPMPRLLNTVGRLAERYPRCTIVLEHLGWTGGSQTGDGLLREHFALRNHPNLLFKWTTLNIDDLDMAGIPVQRFLRAAVDVFGPAKLMWGSDFGNSLRPYEGLVAEARNGCGLLTSRESAMVLGDTAREVFLSRSRPG